MVSLIGSSNLAFRRLREGDPKKTFCQGWIKLQNSPLFTDRRIKISSVHGIEPDVVPLEHILRRNLHRFAALIKRSEEHTSELQSLTNLVCRLLLEKKKQNNEQTRHTTNSKKSDK